MGSKFKNWRPYNMSKQLKTNLFENIALGLFAILGISFWFWLAFPWENSNESYSWLYALKNAKFFDVFKTDKSIVPNFRPLNQFVAYAGYKLTDGDIYIHQLFNYVITSLAWFFLCLLFKEKRLIAITSMLSGAFLFSIYIYLFHPHGLGYSPVLLLITSLIYLFDYRQRHDFGTILLAYILTLVIHLFHPAALLVFIGYFSGFILEKLKSLKKKELILPSIFLFISGMIVIFIRIGTSKYTIDDQITGFLTTYNMIEVHRLVSLFLFILSIATIVSLERLNKYYKMIIGLLCTILSIYFYSHNLPITIIWIIISLIKMILIRKWSIAFLILLTVPLPLGLPFGSPTYSIYAVMACTIAFPFGWQKIEEKINFITLKTVVPIYILAIIIMILVRSGINIPVISPISKPLLAEKEKTFQLRNIMDWAVNSKFKDYKLVLHREKLNPSSNQSESINRTNIPPTSQMYVDIYMKMKIGIPNEQMDSSKKLIITFGNEKIYDMHLLKRIKGKFAGDAMIFYHPSNDV